MEKFQTNDRGDNANMSGNYPNRIGGVDRNQNMEEGEEEEIEPYDIAESISNQFYTCLLYKIVDKWHVLNHEKKVIATASSFLTISSATPFWESEIYFKNGNVYQGQTLNKKLDGPGKFYWPNGICYTGTFEKNRIIGNGSIMFTDGSRYEGEMNSGWRHGNGVMSTDTYHYMGLYRRGKRHGRGLMTWCGDNKFLGEWRNDFIVKGVRTFLNGIFDGKYLDEQHSFGKLVFNSGDIYVGGFKNCLFHGYGVYEWNGNYTSEVNDMLAMKPIESYMGQWQENRKHGVGILRFRDTLLQCMWRQDMKDGPALILSQNGDCFVSTNMFYQNQYTGSKQLRYNEKNKRYISHLISSVDGTNMDEIFEEFDVVRKCASCYCLDESDVTIDDGKLECPPMELTTEAEMNFFAYIWHLKSHYTTDINAQISPIHIPDFMIDLTQSPIVDFVSHILTTVPPCQLYVVEINSINQVIMDNVVLLKNIYNRYAAFYTDVTMLTFAPIMRQICLWQFYRDLKLHKRDVNIYNTIKDANEIFHTLTYSMEDPFERVSFWQFLKYLLHLCMVLSHDAIIRERAIRERPKFGGLFATLFLIILRDFVMISQPISDGILKFFTPERCEHLRNFADPKYVRQFHQQFDGLTEPFQMRTVIGFWIAMRQRHLHAIKREPKLIFNELNMEIDNWTLEDKERMNSIGMNKIFTSIGFRQCLQYAAEVLPSLTPTNGEMENTDVPFTFLEFMEIIFKLIQRHLYVEKFDGHKIKSMVSLDRRHSRRSRTKSSTRSKKQTKRK